MILERVSGEIPSGSLTILIGENGVGKTTLVDLIMGFRKPTSGSIQILGQDASQDPYEIRQRVAYLSEKVDLPGDWQVDEFLKFNAFFYRQYSKDLESEFIDLFRVQRDVRIGSLSAGEIRRVQIAAGLAAQPELILVDEITAVLDIVVRKRLASVLRSLTEKKGATVFMATNILEDIPTYASHVMILKNQHAKKILTMQDFLAGSPPENFSARVVEELEGK